MGYLIACADSAVMAVHDCDIVTYTHGMLSRLVFPVAHPAFPYHLSKGFYPSGSATTGWAGGVDAQPREPASHRAEKGTSATAIT
uniref:CAZy families GT81 protein n=1 Tax=uncultured Roseobacter sp. TaxID=114847 RepID=A0A060BU51_9RHOB|nr:CAZy families GT81 protein [uncultured Roseobacter sp.]